MEHPIVGERTASINFSPNKRYETESHYHDSLDINIHMYCPLNVIWFWHEPLNKELKEVWYLNKNFDLRLRFVVRVWNAAVRPKPRSTTVVKLFSLTPVVCSVYHGSSSRKRCECQKMFVVHVVAVVRNMTATARDLAIKLVANEIQ